MSVFYHERMSCKSSSFAEGGGERGLRGIGGDVRNWGGYAKWQVLRFRSRCHDAH